jgi:hypothetical protein
LGGLSVVLVEYNFTVSLLSLWEFCWAEVSHVSIKTLSTSVTSGLFEAYSGCRGLKEQYDEEKGELERHPFGIVD